MDKIFESLKGAFKPSGVEIDNKVFRLHYQFTAPVLLAFSILITSKQYFGDPISCISKDDVPAKLLDTFCWIHSTFSLPEAWHKEVGVEVPYPGVDKYTPGESRVYHAYYQWVSFILFLQAILFYVPRYFWKASESGRIKNITLELNLPILETREKDIETLVEYLLACHHHNEFYFAWYSLAELLNFVNVVGQMFLMDTFLGNCFSEYGIRVMSFTEWDQSLRFDPMIGVFPRLTKCTFHRFGSSGDVQRHDAMCILPINIVNEKIYVFLWFWFVALAVISGLAVVYRVLLASSRNLQFRFLQARARLVPVECLWTVLRRCRSGDWFIIHLLAKNLDSVNFRCLMESLASQLGGRNVSEDDILK